MEDKTKPSRKIPRTSVCMRLPSEVHSWAVCRARERCQSVTEVYVQLVLDAREREERKAPESQIPR